MSYGVSVTLSFLGGYTFSQKKGIALAIAVLHFSYFFHGDGLKPRKPSRQGTSRGSPPVTPETVTPKSKKRNAAFGQPAARGVEKDRPNGSFASRSVGGLVASARSEADGNDRLASRRVLEPRAFPGSAARARGRVARPLHHRFIGER